VAILLVDSLPRHHPSNVRWNLRDGVSNRPAGRLAARLTNESPYERIGGHDAITRLLRHFYADVRQDPLIGPIFNARIEDWPQHLEVLASFWEGVIGGPNSYSGPMPKRHAPLQLEGQHFERWLFLWQANCRAQLPSDVAQEMIGLAQHIADRLRRILGVAPVSNSPPR